MTARTLFIAGLAAGLTSSLHADFETPGAGPDYNTMIGGDQDRPWNFWVRAYIGYNDNVQFVPDAAAFGPSEESGYFGITAQGSHRLMKDANMDAGIAFRFDQTFHFEHSSAIASADNFDLTVFEPALYLNFTADQWYGRATYSYRWEDAKTTLIGLSSHNLGLMVGTAINDCWKGEISWVHSWDDFHDGGAGAFDRDGSRDRITLSLIQQGSSGGPTYTLSYSFLHNDADGSTFSYDGHELKLRGQVALAENIGAVAHISYTDLDYDAGFRREQEIFRFGIRFVYVIDDHWSADFYYEHLDIDSNATFSRGTQNNLGIGMRYDF